MSTPEDLQTETRPVGSDLLVALRWQTSAIGWSAFALPALCFVWILLGLVGHEPWKPDEGYTLGLVHNIQQTGDWVVPTLAGEPFMEKPPFYFITAAGLGSLLGTILPFHDAARLATGLFLALTVLCLAFTERELKGSRASVISPLIFMGCIGLFEVSHRLQTDMSLLAGFALAIYAIALSRRRPQWGGFLLGVGTGIAFMSKGLLGPGVVGLACLFLAGAGYWERKAALQVSLWAIAGAAPWLGIWPTALYLRSPALFDEWFWHNNIGRFMGSAHLGPDHERWFYLKTLAWFAFPALPMAIWAARHEVKEVKRGLPLRQSAFALPLAFLLSCALVLGFAGEARALYALPMLLPLSLMGSLSRAPLTPRIYGVLGTAFRIVFSLAGALLWIGWIALVSHWPAALHLRLMDYRPAYVEDLDWDVIALAVGLTIAWVALEFSILVPRAGLLWRWSLGMTLVWGLCATLWVSYIDYGKAYRGVFLELGPKVAGSNCVASRGLGEPQRALLKYYLGLVTVREEVTAASNCGLMLIQSAGDDVSIPAAGPSAIIWQGHRPGDQNEVFQLVSRDMPTRYGMRPALADSGSLEPQNGDASRAGAWISAGKNLDSERSVRTWWTH